MEDQRLARIETKLDDVADHLASIDATLMSQHVSLRDHMRRTQLLEKELKPVKKHVDMVSGALKLLTYISIILGITLAIRSLLL